MCLDFETDVISWNRNRFEVFLPENETDFEATKQQELSCWVANDEYGEVYAVDDAILGLRWVLSVKTLDGSSLMPKARQLVKRYLEDLPKFQCESPALSRRALKVFFSICASQNWAPQSLDIKTAILQAKSLDRDFDLDRVRPLKEVPTSKIWKFIKPVYGLKDASKYLMNYLRWTSKSAASNLFSS